MSGTMQEARHMVQSHGKKMFKSFEQEDLPGVIKAVSLGRVVSNALVRAGLEGLSDDDYLTERQWGVFFDAVYHELKLLMIENGFSEDDMLVSGLFQNQDAVEGNYNKKLPNSGHEEE